MTEQPKKPYFTMAREEGVATFNVGRGGWQRRLVGSGGA